MGAAGRGDGVVKVNWADGAVLTVTIDTIGRSAKRTLSARFDLSDDRSFLSVKHRDLVERLPNLSIHPGQPTGQGWIRVGIGAASCELHVVLKRLPSSTDLVLGQCAAELLTTAIGDASDPQA